MAPPSILTYFGRAPSRSRDEVVIDGESSSESDEEEVMVITPQSRKRNRTSAIMDEDDEDDEDDEQPRLPAGMTNVTPPPVKQRRVLSPRRSGDDDDDGRVRGVRRADSEDEDDDDEVEIIQMGANATPLDGSASKKNRRLTINDTDDDDDDDDDGGGEHEQEDAKEERKGSFGATMTPTLNRRTSIGVTPGSSASRRSSRIERKRQEKEVEHLSARKLEYLSLDNCLDAITNGSSAKRKTNTRDTDDDDFEEEEEEVGTDDHDNGFFASKSGRRTSSMRKEVEREGRHADGDDDLDEFIVGDNEVEYMDDDENGVISVESGSDDDVEDDEQDFATMRAAQQTREPSEWFAIYLEYIEECIIDADLDNRMRRRQSNIQYQLYKEAIRHIERAICSRRDTLRGSVAWPDDMLACLKTASFFRTSRCEAQRECQACNRQNHMATFSAYLGGVACDATELYRENWMQRLRKSMFVATPVYGMFEMGSVCHARTLAYWQLLHAKRFWCILVDAKRKEVSDVTGRIAKEFRKPFHKQEFGRYKRLLNAADTFEMESRRSNAFMANVWKRVTPQYVQSAFLPTAKRKRNLTDSRRGTMDSFVGESDEEEDEEGEDEEEKDEEEAARALNESDKDDGDDDDEEEKEEPDAEQRSSRKNSRVLQETQAVAKSCSKGEDVKPSNEGKAGGNTSEAEDLLCLVCGENPRNGGIVHGQYLHFYCCFRCGKRQFRSKMGCLVCDRPIDRVLRLLPLTQEARDSIQKNQQP